MGKSEFAEHGLGAAYRLRIYILIGYDGCTRNSAKLSADHFLSVADKVYVARHGRIWGGNTKLKIAKQAFSSRPRKSDFSEGGLFFILAF